MLEHKEYVNLLLDYYGELLTDKQQEIMTYYFKDDLSLAEIAENLQVSRSAVHDLIKRSEGTLQHYEEKLSMIIVDKKQNEIIERYRKLESIEVQQLIDELLNIE